MNAPQSRDPRDHLLTSKEIDDLFKRHVQPVIEARQRFTSPTIVPIMGQAGAGKTTLATVMPERLAVMDPYIVEHDDLDRLHPSFTALRDEFGEMEAREVIDSTESIDRLFEKILDFGLTRGYNLALPAPMNDSDWVAPVFAQWRSDYGARIHVVALAVHEAHSLLGTVDRLRQEIELTGSGREIKQDWHDQQYSGVTQILQRIEADGLADSITCVARGGRRVCHNMLIGVDPAVTWRDPPGAAAAVDAERSRLWTYREHLDFHRRAMAVAEFARSGGLTPEQAASAAVALRRGLAQNDQAVTMLRTHASHATNPQAANDLTQLADQRGQYNRQISAATDRLDALAGTRSKGRAAAARGSSVGLARSKPTAPGLSTRASSTSIPASRRPGRRSSPGR